MVLPYLPRRIDTAVGQASTTAQVATAVPLGAANVVRASLLQEWQVHGGEQHVSTRVDISSRSAASGTRGATSIPDITCNTAEAWFAPRCL
jgi:hypothetical protein